VILAGAGLILALLWLGAATLAQTGLEGHFCPRGGGGDIGVPEGTMPWRMLLPLVTREMGALPSTKGGPLTQDETWSGEILVTDTVIVPEGVTLTIEPGTMVRFRHYRGYQEGKVGLIVQGGTIKAIGGPTEQIWFTSDAPDPINGDWGGITLVNTEDSEFDYVIVEYAEIGIEQFASGADVSNSIIRWNNSEGLYAELSSAVFQNNTIYANAYHAIALENYNEDIRIIGNLILGDGHQSVHLEASQALIEGNYFKNFDVSAGMSRSTSSPAARWWPRTTISATGTSRPRSSTTRM